MLIVNYKAYEKAIGEDAEKITEKIEEGAPEDSEVIVSPQTVDLNRIDTELEKFSQHIDPVATGSHTGSNQMEAIKDSGTTGTLLNH